MLNLIVQGYSYKLIAAELFISLDTVRSHMAVVADIDGVQVPFLHINQLIDNKKAVNLPKDQLGIIELERIQKKKDERPLSQLIEEAPYLEDRIGQSFIMLGGKPGSAANNNSLTSKELSIQIIKDASGEAAKILREMVSDSTHYDFKTMLEVATTKAAQWIRQNHNDAVKKLSDLEIEQQVWDAWREAGVLVNLNSDDTE